MKKSDRRKLDELLELDDNELSAWELEFTDNIDQQDRNQQGGLSLSPKQADRLKIVHRKHITKED